MSNLSRIFFAIASLLIFPQRLPAQKPTILPEAQNLHGLSYVQVRQELLSRQTYELQLRETIQKGFGAVTPKADPFFVDISSYSAALRERIIHANVTDEERETLWWLYLYTNLVFYRYRVAPFTKIVHLETRVTPKMPATPNTQFFEDMRSAGKISLISAASLGLATGIISKLSHPHAWNNREHFARAIAVAAGSFLWVGCVSAAVALGNALLASSLGPTAPEHKAMLKVYEFHTKAVGEYLPSLARKITNALQEKLSECPWELTYGSETTINHSAFQKASDILAAFYATLERLARIEPGEEIA